MNEIISVIIPVYNVEAYLRQCLDSVLTQSYSLLQVIVIDDGSTDRSGTICDEYVAKDDRVVVIHQKNGGAAAAKNAGLRVATGKYLAFVDSDDFLEPDAYSHMIALLNSSGVDVVQCSFQNVFQTHIVPHAQQGGLSEFTAVQYLEQFTKDWTCGLLWDKLYIRSIFEDVWFEEGHKIDDEYFTYRGIMNATKIVRDTRIVYNYRNRRSSVMYSPESGKQIVRDRIDYLCKRRKAVIARFPELRQTFDRHFLDMMVILSRDPNGSTETIKLIREQLKMYQREKDHSPADIRLWPSLLKISLGYAKPVNSTSSDAATDTNCCFD